jgi:hypothetical protein
MSPDAPSRRAEELLQRVVGPERFTEMQGQGFLDLPSRLVAGRVYRLDRDGGLLYREPGEPGFRTTLCVQPQEAVPRDDVVAMRYLLVTADEERLLEVANPIAFGFVSLSRALHHDFAQRHAAPWAALFAGSLILLFLGSLLAQFWLLGWLMLRNPGLAVALVLLLLVPAFIGGVLAVAGAVELWYVVRTALVRRRGGAF